MKEKKDLRIIKFLSYLLASFFIISVVGCATVMPHRGEVGRAIDENLVSKIQPGKTTREEIIQWFGIPTAVAKKGEIIKMSGAMAMPMGGGEMPGVEISSETYFVLFSNRKITENHKIYLYIHTKTSGMGFSVPFVYYTGGKTGKTTLVILMDESRGVVEDYKLDKQI